jgi:hypothetical protein
MNLACLARMTQTIQTIEVGSWGVVEMLVVVVDSAESLLLYLGLAV